MLSARARVVTLAILAAVAGLLLAIADAARRASDKTAAPDAGDHPGDSAARPSSAPSTAWVLPHDGACPTGFPVKVKESSGIFHIPGGAHYARVNPDRCYRSAEAAGTDGFRQSRT